MSVTGRRSADGRELVIEAPERFDFTVHAEFREAYRDVQGPVQYIVDLARTEYMDSSALGMLLLLREHAGDGSRVRIINLQPDVRQIMDTANLGRLLAIE